MAFLKLPSVWLCFSFFFWSTCALSAIQSFASPALQSMYGLPLSLTAMVVTGYMLGFSTFMPLTAWLRDRLGHRRLYMLSLAVFVLGVLVATPGVAPAQFIGAAGRVGFPHPPLGGSLYPRLPNVGFGELSPDVAAYMRTELERLTGGDKAAPVVFYCDPSCWMSWNAAKRAVTELGYTRVYWYPEGAQGWKEAGQPLVAAQAVPMAAPQP